MSAWRTVAHIVKPRNLEGALVVRSAAGLPFVLQPGMHVWFVPPVLRTPREADVVRVTQLSESTWEVFFSDVEDIATAEKLVNSSCLALRSDLPHTLESELVPVGLEGWLVIDGDAGELGCISRIDEGAVQSLLVVEGAKGEILIPLVDEFICQIDEEQQIVQVALPEGLISLNSSEGN